MDSQINTKLCPKCGKEKPLEEFYKIKRNDRPSSYCKECFKLLDKIRRKEKNMFI